MHSTLTIPEEILLLSVDDAGGISSESKTLDVVLASAILMDLAIKKRIDTDLSKMIHLDSTPTGDAVLDDAIGLLFKNRSEKPTDYWITQLGLRADVFKEDLLASLVVKRVLKVENKKILWMIASRKYPVIDNKELVEVKTRCRELIFSSEIPELQEMAIISLAYYGSMLGFLLNSEEQVKYQGRVEQIARMDLVGQAIGKALQELSASFQLGSIAKSILGIKTAEQKLEILVSDIKAKYRIDTENDLPEWLRKGTAQYQMTIDFIEKTGSSDIYYHPGKKEYFLRDYSSVFSM
jgi:Golgi phosphoprotein 3